MTREYEIEKIKDILEEATQYENAVCYVTSNDEEPLKMAVADMEKQIPKFIESKGFKGVRDTRYKCPACKKFVRVNTKYCDECGQALKFPKLKRIDNRFEFDWTEEGE